MPGAAPALLGPAARRRLLAELGREAVERSEAPPEVEFDAPIPIVAISRPLCEERWIWTACNARFAATGLGGSEYSHEEVEYGIPQEAQSAALLLSQPASGATDTRPRRASGGVRE